MEGAVFKERALVEGRRYAKDRMVFLRELCQNSRDAGATLIHVTTRFEQGDFVMRFEDNGAGMSFDHAERYLFRLYASSKEQEKQSSGCFGVGFWSILLFCPDILEIESRPQDGPAWRVVTDGELSRVSRQPGDLRSPGTVVSVRLRTRGRAEHDQLVGEAFAALSRHCRYLRRNDPRATPLPIRFNRRRVDGPFELDGPCWLTFSEGTSEGAVGLGETPSVEVYARGLLVWHGTLLDELAYGAKKARPLEHPRGLSPRFVLNGNDLNVTYDRRKVVDDRALQRLRLRARRRMRELLSRYLDRISPRPLHQRFRDGIRAFAEDFGAGRAVKLTGVLAIVLLLGAGGWWLAGALTSDAETESTVRVPREEATGRRAPLSNPRRYLGASTEADPLTDRIPLVYRPEIETAFRVAAVERLDPHLGIQRETPVLAGPLAPFSCTDGCLDIAAEIRAATGLLIIPLPTGHRLDTGSVRLNRNPVNVWSIAGTGEPALKIDEAVSGKLTYRSGPATLPLSSRRQETLTALPGGMTASLDALARRLLGESDPAVQVALAERLVMERLIYDNSAAVSERYAAFFNAPDRGGWLDFVLASGRGDCDVKNAVLVFLLRRLGIPSRLAIGALGQEGRALPGMHAWTEYYLDGWRTADATGGGAMPPSERRAAEASAVPRGRPLEAPVSDLGAVAVNEIDTSVPPSFWMRPELLRNVAVVAAIVGALSLLLGVATLFSGRKRTPIYAPGGDEKQQTVAAEILASAMAHPEMWMKGAGLKKRPLLPVLGRRTGMSLDEASARGRNSTLWRSAGRTGLAKRAVARGARVLDAREGPFRKVIARLPGGVDLDEIAALSPVRPDEVPEPLAPVGSLVREMNRVLRRCGLRGLTFRLTLHRREFAARDVDLTGLGFNVSKYIVLPAESDLLTTCKEAFPSKPGLAVFTAINGLMKESAMLRQHRPLLLAEAAHLIFEDTRWTAS